MTNLSRDEQETHINQTAQDRIDGFWEIYSDDPVWQRRLDDIAECIAEHRGGGKTYRVKNAQVKIRPEPRELSEEEKEQRRMALEKARAAQNSGAGASLDGKQGTHVATHTDAS